jgi:hypothetical protein
MRAIVLPDDGFPTSYIQSGSVRLDFIPADLNFSFVVLSSWDQYQRRPEHYKWFARVASCTIKPGIAGADLQLSGYWQLDIRQRELRSMINLESKGFKFYADINEEIWKMVGLAENNPPVESHFLSLREATERLAASYGVSESSVKISITN